MQTRINVPVPLLDDFSFWGQFALKCSTEPQILHPPPGQEYIVLLIACTCSMHSTDPLALTFGVESPRIIWTGAGQMSHLIADEAFGIWELACVGRGAHTCIHSYYTAFATNGYT